MTLSAVLRPHDPEFSTSYELLLACYLSGQVSERQWTEHLKDEHFAAWIARRERIRKGLAS